MLNAIATSIVVILAGRPDAHGAPFAYEIHTYTSDDNEQTKICRSRGSFCLSEEETAYTGPDWAYERTVAQ